MLRSLVSASLGMCLIAVTPLVASAGKVKVWNHYSPEHYEKAVLRHAVVSSEGALRLSRQLRPLAKIDASHVWDVIDDHDGNLLVATGDDGKIFKVTSDGAVSVVYAGEETEVFCLARGRGNAIYAGTGPHGHVLRIKSDGSVSVFYECPERYIWSLAMDTRRQLLYAGTGPKGRIYQIDARGRGQLFYQTRQDHVLAVALGGDGTLYAGTDKNGLVYRVSAAGKGFVVYSAPQAEVRRLLVTRQGIYAATSAPGRTHVGGGDRIGSSYSGPASTVSLTRNAGDSTMAVSTGRHHLSSATNIDHSNTSPSAGTPSSGENSLYCICHDGSVREVFREKALILSVLHDSGRLLVGTGTDGQIFEVDEATKERSETARLDNAQIHCLYRRRDGSIVVGTGDPGMLYVLQDRYAHTGTVTSDVLDAHMISRWGSLSWTADTPPGTSISISVRTGNVAEPDETWSDWSEEQTDAALARVTAPAARFLQYRARLHTENSEITPTLRDVAIRYMPTNQAPEVTNIEVPDLDAGNLDNPKKLKIRWSASDANDDELSYSLYVRKDGWQNWVRLDEDLEHKSYEWDTTTTPSGRYRVKVVASDCKDNPTSEARTGERISEPFIVAHEPPVVSVKLAGMDGEQAIIEATARDPMVHLASASYAVNSKKWVNVFPTDGLFDSKNESFRFKTAALRPGAYVLVLRVTDAAGNVGSSDAVFAVPRR